MTSLTAMRLLAVALLLGSLPACSRGPSFREASQELAELVDPAVVAALPAGVVPDRFDDPGQCSDPFFGPSAGLRPTISYEVPLAVFEQPDSFILAVERAWESKGLDVQKSEEEGLVTRRISKGPYRARALVNFADQMAYIDSSGPCVEGPQE